MRRQRCGSVAVAAAAVMVLSASGRAEASGLTVLYTFPPGRSSTPTVSIVRGLTLYGVDPTFGSGTIFRLNPSRTIATLHAFTGGGDGGQPNTRLVIDGKGEIFGTTVGGGSAGLGTVFRLSAPTRTLTTLHSFLGSPDGAAPYDGLALSRAGALVGAASQGDISPGNGEVFSVTPSGSMSVIYEFLSSTDGHCPFTGVALAGDGSMFGTTVGFGFGGQSNGSVFKLTQHPSVQVKTLYAFTNGEDGEYPQITPTWDAAAGNLYGVSNEKGGASFAGSVWAITSSGFKILHSFSGGADGYLPNGPLALGHDGNLYGTTSGGGSASGGSGRGTVFRVTPAGQFSTVYTFAGGADGSGPTGRLAFDASGNIYGGTGAGTIYEIMP